MSPSTARLRKAVSDHRPRSRILTSRSERVIQHHQLGWGAVRHGPPAMQIDRPIGRIEIVDLKARPATKRFRGAHVGVVTFVWPPQPHPVEPGSR